MKIILALALLSALADTIGVTDKIDSTVVTASRAGKDTPIPYTSMSAPQLRIPNPKNSLPMTLGYQPSVVATNEGGTGIGYTALRIRGVPGSQTIVSLNGITLNDAEDQEVFWANIPSIVQYLGSVQIQRGLGTTVSGPGAFGASVNMVTSGPGTDMSGGASLAYGAFNTFTSNVNFSTGLTGSGLFGSAAFSYNSTDGYMKGGFGKVWSVFANAGWHGSRDLVALTFLHGNQRTGITWEGVPLDVYWKDRRYNPAEGNTDNYRQTHAQLNWKHAFGSRLKSDATFNYTKGYGYYEYSPRRDILDNSLLVFRGELKYGANGFSASGGLYLSSYTGAHLGRTNGAASGFLSGSGPDVSNAGGTEIYTNNARKREADAWLRAEWSPLVDYGPVFYADVQMRAIRHEMYGPDEYGQVLAYNEPWTFVNPRLGVTWKLPMRNRLFASAAFGHREPGRADIQSFSGVRPEKMLDFELGHKFSGYIFKASTTLYAMEYFDMLVETGRLDSGGYAIKENVGRAFRRGIEFSGEADWRLFRIEGNIAFSVNRIRNVGDIVLSPSVVGMLRWTQYLWPGGTLALSGKLVGSQYWDNSSDPAHRIPAYCVFDLMLRHRFHYLKGLSSGLYVDNLFNHQYYSYATSAGVYPQAPINLMFRLEYSFPHSFPN